MNRQVTVTLPDALYEGVERLAESSGHDVADVLARTLTITLSPLLEQPATQDLELLSNAEVLVLADSMMEGTLSQRMSELSQKNKASKLDAIERHELSLLLYVYNEGSMRKAEGLVEAVKRGLRQRGIQT